MTLVRNDTFGVLSIEPAGPHGLLDVVNARADVSLWPVSQGIAQTYGCADIQPVGHVCDPSIIDSLPAPEALAEATELVDSTLTPGDYTVVVTATNSLGETTGSAPVDVTVDADQQIDVAWGEVDGATGYNVYINGGLVGSATGTTLTYDGTEAPGPEEPPTENSTGNAPAKRFDGLDLLDGHFVTLQGGIMCSALGLTGEEGKRYAADLFGARESAGVEREFLNHVLATAGAVDLTPTSGAVDERLALAILEGYGLSHYAGQVYLHAPATVGSLLFARGAAKFEDGTPATKLGSPLVVGAGYDYPSVGPDGDVADEGTYWLYVTGQPLIGRGDLKIYEALDHVTNEQVVLAERPYVLSADCMVAAINVTLEG